MNIGFFIGEMNYRGVSNSSYQYAHFNELILKNKSIIFFNKKEKFHKKEVITKFKKRFTVFGINGFKEVDKYIKKFNLKYIYVQKGGQKDVNVSKNLKTLVHSLYPQNLKEVHGFKYSCVSEWQSNKFTNKKIPFVPYIVNLNKTKLDLKKTFNIKKKDIVFGCHGGETSFDLKFVHQTIEDIAKKRNDIFFLFLNIKRFCNHSRIIFLKGSFDEVYKKKFINTCDAMIYGRSLGESFGLACAEFSNQGKKLITYKFNKHKSHIYKLPKNNYEEYFSRKSLFDILTNFQKNKSRKLFKNNKYLTYSPTKVMRTFNKVFLKKHRKAKLTFYDYLVNQMNFLAMHYRYFRHKIYINYYQIFESKFIYHKD
tara:strand:- start:52 stop:1155 length:1104 start_codon:yes stop_codon:yes gene_type:complete